jgi:multiple sugar transport system permease protein/sn-glycerol 3-phosphate transport system permease protein
MNAVHATKTNASETGKVSRASKRFRTFVTHLATYLFLGLGSLIFLVPLFWQISTSLKTSPETILHPPIWFPAVPQWQNYIELMDRFPFLIYARNSFTISFLVIFGTVFSNSLAAYGFSRLRMPGRDKIFMLLLSTLMLPGIVLIIPQFMLFQTLHWTNTYNPLIIPSFFGSAFYLFLMRQFFMGIPRELEDAARIDGAGYFRIYAQIILPLCKPVLVTVALFTFVGTWNDFFGPLIYLSDAEKYTVAVALRYLSGSVRSRPEHHLTMAAATLSIIPCLVAFFAAQRQFIQGTVITGIKG